MGFCESVDWVRYCSCYVACLYMWFYSLEPKCLDYDVGTP
jgi:hypothetical protein